MILEGDILLLRHLTASKSFVNCYLNGESTSTSTIYFYLHLECIKNTELTEVQIVKVQVKFFFVLLTLWIHT